MDIRVAAYAVIVDERGILLSHWNEGGHSGWTLPGGGIDPGEDPADAAVREVFEETGYHADLGDLLGVDSHVVPPERRIRPANRALHSLRIVYRASLSGGALTYEADGSTDYAAWFPLEQVDSLDRVSLVDVGRRFAGLI